MRREEGMAHTPSSGTKRAITVATHNAGPDDLAVDVLHAVWVDVAGAAAAVGDFGGGHFISHWNFWDGEGGMGEICAKGLPD